MPHKDVSVEQLRKQVVEARKKTALMQEKKRLESELFRLRNPNLLTFKKGFVSGAKAFGRGATITAKGIQKFAIRQQEMERRKVKSPIGTSIKSKQKAFKKFKTKTIPVLRGGQVVSFKEVRARRISSPIVKKRKKRRTFQRNNNGNGFSDFSPSVARFDF